jgi:hypothetical protein
MHCACARSNHAPFCNNSEDNLCLNFTKVLSSEGFKNGANLDLAHAQGVELGNNCALRMRVDQIYAIFLNPSEVKLNTNISSLMIFAKTFSIKKIQWNPKRKSQILRDLRYVPPPKEDAS